MNRLSTKQRAQIIAALVEGNSIRATCRMTGAAKGTVLKLLTDIGKACAVYQDKVFRNLKCGRIQCEEIWSFCYAKAKNVPEEKHGQFGYGDVWTWTAICADTKLVPTWMVAPRTAEAAKDFINDLSERLANRVQLTTDGNKVYVDAVEDAFAGNIDYAMLVKMYGNEGSSSPEARYSPAECTGTRIAKINGNPDPKHVSTSFAERQNLTMRMSMRRFTRLTNAFSKKIENLMHAVSLHFMYYNFARIHQTLRVTPAMEAGITDRVWSVKEIAGLLD
ncbi:MAG: IS1 family transposase [Deltaproteobacteria bacterium]|nr:IS1 family transposase [Deltaproteobacteria bacterium]